MYPNLKIEDLVVHPNFGINKLLTVQKRNLTNSVVVSHSLQGENKVTLNLKSPTTVRRAGTFIEVNSRHPVCLHLDPFNDESKKLFNNLINGAYVVGGEYQHEQLLADALPLLIAKLEKKFRYGDNPKIVNVSNASRDNVQGINADKVVVTFTTETKTLTLNKVEKVQVKKHRADWYLTNIEEAINAVVTVPRENYDTPLKFQKLLGELLGISYDRLTFKQNPLELNVDKVRVNVVSGDLIYRGGFTVNIPSVIGKPTVSSYAGGPDVKVQLEKSKDEPNEPNESQEPAKTPEQADYQPPTPPLSPEEEEQKAVDEDEEVKMLYMENLTSSLENNLSDLNAVMNTDALEVYFAKLAYDVTGVFSFGKVEDGVKVELSKTDNFKITPSLPQIKNINGVATLKLYSEDGKRTYWESRPIIVMGNNVKKEDNVDYNYEMDGDDIILTKNGVRLTVDAKGYHPLKVSWNDLPYRHDNYRNNGKDVHVVTVEGIAIYSKNEGPALES